MALRLVPSAGFLAAFVPIARQQLLHPDPTTKSIPLLSQLRTALLLPSIFIPIPALLGDLWDGLLNAAPKKKTSHMKKRHRQMAGKALKDVTALNKCSACGRAKRAHVLCPYCVQSIKRWFGNGFKSKQEVEAEESEMWDKYNEELRVRGRKQLERPKKKDK